MPNYNYCFRCQRDIDTDDHYDARGIYITRCCDDCWSNVAARYRPEVLTDSDYECDEPIESEDY
jgi:hypothetical protein